MSKRPAPPSDNEEVEREKLLQKQNAYELSNTKIVYNMEKHDYENLIVRSVREGEKYALFGASGKEAVDYVIMLLSQYWRRTRRSSKKKQNLVVTSCAPF